MGNIFRLSAMLFLVASCATGQEEERKMPAPEVAEAGQIPEARVDSVILRTDHQIIYITADTTAIMYDWLTHRTANDSMMRMLFDVAYIQQEERETGYSMKHFRDLSLDSFWTAVHLYHSGYFVYAPSDWMYDQPMYLTDSAMYALSSADMILDILTSVNRVDPYTVDLSVVSTLSDARRIRIRQIDAERKIYRWSYFDRNGNLEREEYRTPSANVRSFRMIVNDCFDMKCHGEFDFK